MLENPNVRAPIAVSLGAVAGALCRYYVGQWFTEITDTSFPIGTLIVNITGCFLMGLITTLAAQRLSIKPDLMLLLTTGYLGAYTTFSSYELDSVALMEVNTILDEILYWVGSPLLGFMFFQLGIWSIRSWLPVNGTKGQD